MTQTLYEFGEFEIDCARFELRRNGPIVKLEHIPMELHILFTFQEDFAKPVAGRSRVEFLDRLGLTKMRLTPEAEAR